MSQALLLSPPVVFTAILFALIIFSWFASRYAFRAKGASASGAKKAYACGEDFKDHLIQPDYSQFFPFAFFFTILHVVALVVATVPTESIGTLAMALVYIVGAITGLIILLRNY
ncbi:MAG: hypothetical protein PHG40_04785 [Candidatus Omnitrophica bacterium]|nr:hypothetical protein [Candidatus Omnitrophota bacterium]